MVRACALETDFAELPSGDLTYLGFGGARLSGGQRARVALAAVSYAQPHVLILDEPTNNLDLESVAALADAVESFKGGVILVSHDQYFVTEVANEAWVVAGNRVKQVESFAKYRAAQLKKLKK